MVAAVLYISAKSCRAPRPLKELCAVMNVKRKDVSRVFSEIMKLKTSKAIKIQTIDSSAAGNQQSTVEFCCKIWTHFRIASSCCSSGLSGCQNLENCR
eukprot:UN01025